MTLELVPARELAFQLYDVLGVEALCQRPPFAEHSRATFDAALETAQRLADDLFRPHNRKADLEEPRIENGTVRLVPEVKAALDAFAEAGFFAAHRHESLGGMQLPWTVAQACATHFHAANVATFSYAFLTIAAANLLEVFAADDLKRLYLKPMAEGRFFGTMALSEPQAGSSLADIRTRATPTPEGFYRIEGGKMWISAGEHELSENIVHLVLARIQGAPAGIKGISLFLVPRFRPDGAFNDVRLAGLNHKMGWRGTVNTVLKLGEGGDCRGWLVGPANQGLACMFHMMNEARIVIGLSAAAMAMAGYRLSLDYAKNRPQGRAPDAKDPAQPQMPIIGHTDVKRLLLAQKAAAEGSLALGLYCARLVDEQKTADDESERRDAGLLLDILTPIMKAWSSELGLKANDQAIQIHGGYGYTRDYPVEQLYRDNRLNPIHEGTNGIQSIDLLGRKAVMADGAALKLLLAEFRATAKAAHADLPDYALALGEAVDGIETTTLRLLDGRAAKGGPLFLANAWAYLELLGHTTMAWIWLTQALAARPFTDEFTRGKLQACRYVFAWELPKTKALADLLVRFDPTTLDMHEAWF